MDPKDYITNKSFCPLPWTGFFLQADGKVANCVMSKERIGDLRNDVIEDIVASEKNLSIKQQMLANQKPQSCIGCYNLEGNSAQLQGINSSRLYYLHELKKVPLDTYSVDNFSLHHVDLRWQNTCNQACVYCYPEYSSKWEQELGVKVRKPTKEQKHKLKEFVFSNVKQLKNVYLAGGEPLLITENEEFLDLLLAENPDVKIRVNTNLSKTNTKVFDKLLQFKDVHWTVSVESLYQEFEYIRYGGNWFDFSSNLDTISKLSNHKITFNMLWLTLNHSSIFDTIDYFRYLGFNQNSFVIGPITAPVELDIRHLPVQTLHLLEDMIVKRIEKKDGYLLENSYNTMLKHVRAPFAPNPSAAQNFITVLDSRRNLDSKTLFPVVHDLLGETIGTPI